jgi:hypothetical protein
MSAGTYNFTIEQGTTFTRTLTLTSGGVAMNLTGYVARLQARKSVADSTKVIDLAVGSGITITPATGVIVWTLTAAQTAALDFGVIVYDFEIESAAGVVTRVLEGTVTLTKEATR